MAISLIILIISVVFSLADFPSCFSADQQYEECRAPLICGSISSSVFPNITYPFWGNSIGRPSFCGQTKFELSCNDDQNLTLEIESIAFRVISANLSEKTITVADESWLEGGCPKIFNFTGDDRFTLNHKTQTIDLFNCSEDINGNYPPTSLSEISCHLSEENRRTYHVFGSGYHPPNCTKVGEIPMLESAKNVLHQSNGSVQALKLAMEKGFGLRYSIEDKVCRNCSTSGGICGSGSESESFSCLCADKPHKLSCDDDRG